MSWLKDPLHAVEEFINISTSLSNVSELDQLLGGLLSAARRLTSADSGWFYILDYAKRDLFVTVCQSETTPLYCENFPKVSLYEKQHNDDNLTAYCAFTGNTVNIENITSHVGFDIDQFFSFKEQIRYDVQSLLAVPMRNSERHVLGVMYLANMIEEDTGKIVPFPEAIEGLIEAIASQAEVALDNVLLIKKNQELIGILDHTNRRLIEENKLLRSKIQGRYDFSQIIGSSDTMRKVFDLLSRVLESNATVLIRGETGTGKELIANAVHYNSPRREGKLVAQNCAALPENLLESELFGYKKGAFSGAQADKSGLIEMADNGTLFLDEIGDMPLGLQVKLLRVLQEKEVRPLGSVESKKINVRIVAATHCDLEEKIANDEFREDLYYRLSVFPIDIPPLRERKEDIPALLQHFLVNFCKLYDKDIAQFSPSSMDVLVRYDYPGNIREMRNIVERAVLLCVNQGSILVEHLPECVQVLTKQRLVIQRQEVIAIDSGSLKNVVEEFEAQAIRNALEGFNWNQTKTAAALGIGRRTLISKMNRYSIERGPRPESSH